MTGHICDFYSDRENSTFFNRIVRRRLWTKVHGIFHTYKTRQGLFNVKVSPGVTEENFEKIAKKLDIFTLVHIKAITVLTFRPQMSRSNLHLVGVFFCFSEPF